MATQHHESRRAVLITRPRVDAERTASGVTARGFVAVVAPFLEVHHRDVSVPDGLQAVVLTSSNAVPSLRASARKILAVGDVTAARARAAGFTDVESANGDAAALAELVALRLKPGGGKLLLACGKRQGHALAAALRSKGFSVMRRVAYEARPVRDFPRAAADALRGNLLHAALFMSAETAAAFVRRVPHNLHPLLGDVLALAIGKPAADTLKPLPWRQVLTAPRPTLEDLLALL